MSDVKIEPLTVNDGCKKTTRPCPSLLIDSSGNPRCTTTGLESCPKFISFQELMRSGKNVTVRVTDEGLKFARSSLYYWMFKKRYEKVIGDFYSMTEGERNAWIEKNLPPLK